MCTLSLSCQMFCHFQWWLIIALLLTVNDSGWFLFSCHSVAQCHCCFAACSLFELFCLLSVALAAYPLTVALFFCLFSDCCFAACSLLVLFCLFSDVALLPDHWLLVCCLFLCWLLLCCLFTQCHCEACTLIMAQTRALCWSKFCRPIYCSEATLIVVPFSIHPLFFWRLFSNCCTDAGSPIAQLYPCRLMREPYFLIVLPLPVLWFQLGTLLRSFFRWMHFYFYTTTRSDSCSEICFIIVSIACYRIVVLKPCTHFGPDACSLIVVPLAALLVAPLSTHWL